MDGVSSIGAANASGEALIPRRDSLYIVIPITIVYVIIFLTGVAGNVVTCIVISKNRCMHTATNYYLCSLALSDLLLLVSGLPQEVYIIWFRYPYIFSEAFCVMRGMAAETSANATVLTITAFTVERYVAICKPFRSQTMSKLSRAIRWIMVIWLVAFGFAVPQALQFGLTSDSPDPNRVMCAPTRVLMKYSFEVSTFLFFCLPMMVITVLYALIGLRLRRSSSGALCKPPVIQSNGPPSSVDARLSHQATTRVLKMLVAVVVAFFLCWAPFHAQRLVAIYGTSHDHKPLQPLMLKIYEIVTYGSGVLHYVSATLNPILYHIMSHKFREAFKWPHDPFIDQLYDQVFPLRWILTFLLLLPIQKMPDGRVGAPRKSFLMLYTVTMFIVLTAINVDVMLLRTQILRDNASNFTDAVFYFIFLQLLVRHYFIPLVQWPEAPGIADYFNAWTQFQVDWKKSRLPPLRLDFRKRCVLLSCAGIVLPMLLVVSELILAPDLSIYQCIAYAPTAEYFFITSCMWTTFAHGIRDTSLQLSDALHKALDNKRVDYETMREVAKLWKQLAELASLTTKIFTTSMMEYLLYALSIVLTTFFGVLIAVTHRVLTGHTAGQLFIALDNIFHMFIVHEIGHIAHYHVSNDIRNELLLLNINDLPDQETYEEVIYLLNVMKRKASPLTLGGFCECSRSAFVQLGSAAVTYMVVLLQFAFMVPESSESVTVR